MNRAFSIFEVRSVDGARRTFSGWATTPTLDRMGDTVDPLGIKFRNPVPLLWRHNHALPVGVARFDPPTARGVRFVAEVPEVREAGPLRDRVEAAWGEVKYGLARAVSIGFRPIRSKRNRAGGTDYLESEVYELSVVAIPAQADAVIDQVKAMGLMPTSLLRTVAAADREPVHPGVRLVSAGPLAWRPRTRGGA